MVRHTLWIRALVAAALVAVVLAVPAPAAGQSPHLTLTQGQAPAPKHVNIHDIAGGRAMKRARVLPSTPTAASRSAESGGRSTPAKAPESSGTVRPKNAATLPSVAIPIDAMVVESDPYGQLGTGTYLDADGTFSIEPAGAPLSEVAFRFVNGQGTYLLEMGAPQGQTLAAGSYPNASPTPATSSPFLLFGYPDSYGWFSPIYYATGGFTIEELTLDAGAVTAFAATIRIDCSIGWCPDIELRYHSSVPWALDTNESWGTQWVQMDVPFGTPTDATVTVTSSGTAPLTFASPVVTETTAFTVLTDSCSAAPIAPGNTCTIVLRYAASGEIDQGKLTYTTNTASGTDWVGLQGSTYPGTPPGSTGATPAAKTNVAFATDTDVTGCVGPCLPTPNPSVAAGPKNVISASDLSIRITDRTGGQLARVGLPDFFAEQGSFAIGGQVHVAWDALHSRWLATEVTGACPAGTLYLAVSETADPMGSWFVWQIQLEDGMMPELPQIGFSSNKIALAFLKYDFPGCLPNVPWGPHVFVFDSSTALNPNATSLPFYNLGADNVGLPDWHVAQDLTAGNDLQLVGLGSNGSWPEVSYYRITGSVSSKSIAVTSANLTTSGPKIAPMVGDGQWNQGPGSWTMYYPMDVSWANGRLWTAFGNRCNPAGTPYSARCLRLLGLATGSATPAVVDDSTYGEEGKDVVGVGIAAMTDGGVGVTWTQKAATLGNEPVSTFASYRNASDPRGMLHAPTLLSAGSVPVASNQWGYYLSGSSDPVDPHAFWLPVIDTTASGDWATRAVQVYVPGPSGATYKAVAPNRLVDSRSGTRLGLTASLTSGTPATFQVTNRTPADAAKNVPSSAVAVTGNLTVTRQTSGGYLALTPVPTRTPSTSTLNFPVGDNRANAVTVPLGSDGTLGVTFVGTSGATADVIFDVTGYFLPGTSGATYKTVSPNRIVDSRSGTLPGLTSSLKSGVAATFQATGRSTDSTKNIPSTAIAVTGNLTVTRQTSGGYLSLTPVPTNTPTTSTLNFPVGDTRANAVTVPLSSTTPTGEKTLSVTFVGAAGATADVVFDVTGYFLPGTSGATYTPLTPNRLVDSRSGTRIGLTASLKSKVAATFQVTSRNATAPSLNVPSAAIAVTGNLTVTKQTSGGYLAVTPVPTNTPATSTLNFPVGDNRANAVTVPLSAVSPSGYRTLSVTFVGTSGATTDVIFDVTGYFAPAQ